jgi:SAM-dependent methyltransferase
MNGRAMSPNDGKGSGLPNQHGESAFSADAYDDLWRSLEDFLRFNPGARHRRRLVLRALRRFAPTAKTILDVGCGVGEMEGFLADRLPGRAFTGIDLSPVAIDSCRRRMPSLDWRVVDIVRDELPTGFDVVLCSELLEHLDQPDLALNRIAETVRPGGIAIVTVPSGRVFPTERAVGHVRHPSAETLHDWFDRADLDLLEMRHWGWPAYLALKSTVNLDPNRALAAFGSGRYSWAKRRLNDLAYALTGAGSLPNFSRGPQAVVVARRR